MGQVLRRHGPNVDVLGTREPANPGADNHTSVALHDPIEGVGTLRGGRSSSLQRPRARAFCSRSVVPRAAAGVVVGFGARGYLPAPHGVVRKSAVA